jgi:hypothetical protein
MIGNEVAAEDKRLDLALEGNAFAALGFLQGAIRHCLWRREPNIHDLEAALKIESAQGGFLAEVMNKRWSSGYDSALASRAEAR